MSSFWLGLLTDRLLWGRRAEPQQTRIQLRDDADEVHRCGHCNAKTHRTAKRCSRYCAHLNDETKTVETTYTWGQVWSPDAVFVALLIVMFIGLKAVCG